MRIDATKGITARDWINGASKKEIEDVLWNLGEERASRKIARKIVYSREKNQLKQLKTSQILFLIPYIQNRRNILQQILLEPSGCLLTMKFKS